MSQKYDSIIFDLDGTLWDAVETYAKSWNIYFELKGIKRNISKKELDILMGLEEKYYLEKVIPEFTEEERKNIYNKVIEIQYQLIEKEGGVIYDGVIEGLKKLSRYYKLFIVSNCPKFTIKHFIHWSNISNYISGSIAHGENFKSKYENIKIIQNNYDLKKSIYVGDTDSDRKQSEKANIPFIFMDYGFGKCDIYLNKFSSFKDFTEYILKS